MDHQKDSVEFLENYAPLDVPEKIIVESDSSDRSVSGDDRKTRKNGLLVKLKIRKAAAATECTTGVESIHNHSPKKENRNCSVCNKMFSSRKALGGHMRIHAPLALLQDDHDDDILKKSKLRTLHHHHHHHHHRKKLKNHHLDNISVPVANCIQDDNSAAKASLQGIKPNIKDTQSHNSTSCAICGKKFPSMKSLFGHMRCHPDRYWRGIQPPAPPPKTSPSSTVSDSNIGRKMMDDQMDSAASTTTTGRSTFDLSQSLSSWSVTAKRGRKNIASSTSEEERVADGLCQLMMLALAGDSLDSTLSNKRTSDEAEAPSPTKSKKAKVEDKGNDEQEVGNNIDFIMSKKMIAGKGNCVSKPRFGPAPANVESGWQEETDVSGEGSKTNTDYSIPEKLQIMNKSEIVGTKMKKKKKKKKKKLRDLETVQNMGLISYNKQMPVITSTKYKCTTCNKSFPSHQALGGHRSSHKKDKNSIVDVAADMEESTFADTSAEEEEVKEHGDAFYTTQVIVDSPEFDDTVSGLMVSRHPCKICNKTFLTGQALGGHQRCHWKGPVEAPTSSVTAPNEVSKMGRVVLDFDLNELPVIEDEEGLEFAASHSIGIKQPVDYTTYSYHSVA